MIGSDGVLNLRAACEPLAHLLPGSPFQPPREPRVWTPVTSAGVGRPEPIADLTRKMTGHLVAARDLLSAVRDDRQPLYNADEGRTTVEMITAVFASQRFGGQRVTLPLRERNNPWSDAT